MDSSVAAERLIPSDPEAERGVLGSLLLDPEAVSRVVQILQPNDFYAKVHQHIYTAMLDLFDQDRPVDPVLLKAELDRARRPGQDWRDRVPALARRGRSQRSQLRLLRQPGQGKGHHAGPSSPRVRT